MSMAPPTPASCPICGGVGTLSAKSVELTEKRRVKFGIFWVLLTLISLGLGLLLYLVMPRKNVVTGVDRFKECSACKSRV